MEKKEIYDMVIQELIEKQKTSLILITHDLGLVALGGDDDRHFGLREFGQDIRADQRRVETVVRRRVSDRRRLYGYHKSDCTERM